MSSDFIHRHLEAEIRRALPMREMVAIVGARQAGKTTLMRHISDSLEPQKVCFLDFEDREDLALFSHDIKAFSQIYAENYEYLGMTTQN